MITQALVANGAKVYITSRRDEGDVSDKSNIKCLYDEMCQKEPKGIQLLVNNAGIATKYSTAGQPEMSDPQAITDHFWQTEEQSWADTFETNVTGVYYMTMAFLPLLERGREVTPGYTSSVVNVTSISGFMKGNSSGQFAYASSKAVATHLTRMLATTFAETKVRVNCIAPGVFPSEMTTGESGEGNKSVIDKGMSSPAGRPGNDFDMAASTLFLAGPGGVFSTNRHYSLMGVGLSSSLLLIMLIVRRKHSRSAGC
ncbi:NAD(P)-binding protein [Lentithecium fluviatile CBS 122367]|uniref:NAD(P)-binding protein n=1 Tax=Lentithecium fluviatile CBS 122367 TaxID=1168545 RepID=A0A6G1IYY5_9PLEO|nr:NAD(P)-binding protein [Lentithecium fluviatile CBS 122367]